MRRRFIAASAVAVAFLAAVASLERFPAPGPLGDEATDALAVASLAHDHDLRFSEADLERSYAWFTSGPRGLALASSDGGATRWLAPPPAFALAALPFYGVFGARGILLFQALLCVALAGFAWSLRGAAGDAGGLYALGFVVGSAALGAVFRLGPHLFEFACVFFALGLWWRSREASGGMDGAGPPRRASGAMPLALAGLLLGVAVSQEPLALFLVAAVLVDLSHARPRRAVLVAACAAAAWTALVGVERLELRGAGPGALERRVFFEPEALDRGADGWKDGLLVDALPGLHAVERRPLVVLRNAGYLLVGRHTGLLPFFPFVGVAFAMFVGGRRDRVRWLLFAALLGGGVVLALARAEAWSAPLGDLGYRRWAALAPAAFFLPAELVRRRWLVLAAVAAGLWTLPAAIPRWERDGRGAAGSLARRALPLELTLLGAHRLDDYAVRVVGETVWALPRHAAYTEEPNGRGVWLAGAERAEIVLVSAQPLDRVAFRLFSFAPGNLVRVRSGADEVKSRFDSDAKRDLGVPIELPVRTLASDLGGFLAPTGHEHYGSLTIETSSGGVPHRVWKKNPDLRYLGAFLSFDGSPP